MCIVGLKKKTNNFYRNNLFENFILYEITTNNCLNNCRSPSSISTAEVDFDKNIKTFFLTLSQNYFIKCKKKSQAY